MIEISARRTVPVVPLAAFAFLSQPHNHHRLVTSRIRLLELELTSDGELRGALMRLRGPLGLRRRARTRLGESRRPARLAGTARVGSGTDVWVRWELRAAGGTATVVVLTATVTRLAPVDRLLLTLGGGRWVGGLFDATLERLASELARGKDSAGGASGGEDPVVAALKTHRRSSSLALMAGVSLLPRRAGAAALPDAAR